MTVDFVFSHGGWILDNFPKTKEQWTLLVERNTCLPDHVIYLQDESPNGDFLTQRWYAMNKYEIDEQIRERKDRETKPTEAREERYMRVFFYILQAQILGGGIT